MQNTKAKLALAATAVSGPALQSAFLLPVPGHVALGLVGTAFQTTSMWLMLSGAGPVVATVTAPPQTEALTALAAALVLALFFAAYQAQREKSSSSAFAV